MCGFVGTRRSRSTATVGSRSAAKRRARPAPFSPVWVWWRAALSVVCRTSRARESPAHVAGLMRRSTRTARPTTTASRSPTRSATGPRAHAALSQIDAFRRLTLGGGVRSDRAKRRAAAGRDAHDFELAALGRGLAAFRERRRRPRLSLFVSARATPSSRRGGGPTTPTSNDNNEGGEGTAPQTDKKTRTREGERGGVRR